MAFKSFDEVFDPTLKLPGPDGEIFVIPEGDMEIGLWCVKVVTTAQQLHEGGEIEGEPPTLRLEGSGDSAVQRRLLGDAAYERITEVVGKASLDFFATTVMLWHALGRETAEMYWNAGGVPEDFLPAANRAARRAGSRTSTSTAAVKKTRSRASTTGTTSRKAS